MMKIIKKLAMETYQPTPVKRVYIKKSNGKMRPLRIPSFTDKLVEEVLRMILEAVYEPIFSEKSHGFRPKKSCHTTLKDIKHAFPGTRWFIEGDIKDCFDNIEHKTLIKFLRKKIKDVRLIKLVYKFLKAGYYEDFKYHKTYSGTPQGGIISPILANIYLHEFDEYVENLRAGFEKKAEKNRTTEYGKLRNRLQKIKKELETAEDLEKAELVKQLKETRKKLLKTPSKSQTDKGLKYILYADDFLIGVNGNKEECKQIKQKLSEFIKNTLKMELSAEKTLITHSSKAANFLGYEIRVHRNEKIKPDKNGVTKRTLNNKVELNVPFQKKIDTFLTSKGIAIKKNGKLMPYSRANLIGLTDLEIVSTYNAELRGISNYYHMASNFVRLSYFAYIMEYSCLKTLAHKHKSTTSKILKHFRDKKGDWCVPYENREGKPFLYFAKYQDAKKLKHSNDNMVNKHCSICT